MLKATMEEPFTEMLKGGHHNSLGRTAEVVELALSDRARVDELFAGLGEPDELVRMRVGDALEKVCARRPEWFVPNVERLLGEVGEIEQPSVQWHLAQIRVGDGAPVLRDLVLDFEPDARLEVAARREVSLRRSRPSAPMV